MCFSFLNRFLEDDCPQPRVRIRDDFHRDLGERLAPSRYEVRAHPDLPAVHDHDREDRGRLAPPPARDDPPGGLQVSRARPVEAAGMAVVVAHVVGAEAGEEEVEVSLLRGHVRPEAAPRAVRAPPGRHSEYGHDHVFSNLTEKHSTGFRVRMRPAVVGEHRVGTFRDDKRGGHQNRSPVSSQWT
jgi:hypothetical protein